jgi:radical SAM superfamily enzyme YgiQ (UPF0313 family)
MHRPDLVLINPAARRQVYQGLGQELAAVEPPIWAGMMATFVRRGGGQVQVIDAEAEELSPDEVAQRVRDLRPRLVAVVVYGHQPSASTQTMPAAREVCAALQEHVPECKRLLCGGHPAALPQRTLREEPVDFVAGGEGLYTLVDLLDALRTANPSWDQVRDLWYRDGTSCRRGPAAPLVQNLEEDLPGIAWDLLPMERYRAHNWHCLGQSSRQPYAAIYTSLGCPYRCSFCCIQAPFKSGEATLGRSGNSYRLWGPAHVVDQLELLARRYGVRHVKIADEMFVLNRRHVETICDLIHQRGLDLNLWAYARVDTVQGDLLPKLKQAGFNWLAFGIEAADGEVRKGVDKAFDQEDIYRTLDCVRREGTSVIGNYIFGLPEDDLSTMQQTLDLALDLNCEFANFYSAMAYPGSPLYAAAEKNGWPLPRSWSGYSQHALDTQPLPTRHVSAAEVLRFRDEAFNTYYRNPAYLAMIESKFGPAEVAAIRRMTAHRLKREIDVSWGTRLACPT